MFKSWYEMTDERDFFKVLMSNKKLTNNKSMEEIQRMATKYAKECLDVIRTAQSKTSKRVSDALHMCGFPVNSFERSDAMHLDEVTDFMEYVYNAEWLQYINQTAEEIQQMLLSNYSKETVNSIVNITIDNCKRIIVERMRNRQKDKEFYVWTMDECIKSIYEHWGIDMTSMYDNIVTDFPNAANAIHKMYRNLNVPDFYEAEPLTFEKVKYVYQAISNLIPIHKVLNFDLSTKEECDKYSYLNVCSWNKFIPIERIDLLMAILLFTEEFIFQPIPSQTISFKDNQLTVLYGDFVTFRIYKDDEKTYVSIKISNVIVLNYEILN